LIIDVLFSEFIEHCAQHPTQHVVLILKKHTSKKNLTLLPLYAPELFPVNIFDKIPAQHPVRLVEKVVDGLDISSIIKEYKGGGTSAYHPRMMIKVLFYAYLENLYSCRKIEKALQENIHFMYLSGQSTPDFRTINHFRSKVLKDKLQELFKEVVKLLQDLGCVSLEVQYIDGTKIEANANRHRFVWRKSVEKKVLPYI